MFNWLKRLLGRVKRIEVPGLAFELYDRKDPEAGSTTYESFTGFTPWQEAPGVIRGAHNSTVKLKRQPNTSNEDWDLLKDLWFFLIQQGTNTHTFGYKKHELPTQYYDPFARWVHASKKNVGRGAETRITPDGDVVRVNVAADTITTIQ